jgi:5-formyltetrahydrofolate cyclo-ligase
MNELKNQHKIEIRRILKDKRENISKKIILEKSIELCRLIIDSPEFINAQTVSTYISFNKEIDTFYLINKCFELNKTLCVPIVRGSEMVLSRIDSLENLKRNKMGMLEPESIDEIPKNNVDLIIVPGLGFDKRGYRIGYGAGFYDRYLKDYRGHTAGLIFKELLIDFEPEEFDIPVKRLFVV